MMTIIWAVVVGLIIGALARFVLPGAQNLNIIETILLGAAGAFVGSWFTSALMGYNNSNGGIAWIPLIVGVLVAAVFIVIYQNVRARMNAGTRV